MTLYSSEPQAREWSCRTAGDCKRTTRLLMQTVRQRSAPERWHSRVGRMRRRDHGPAAMGSTPHGLQIFSDRADESYTHIVPLGGRNRFGVGGYISR